MHVCTLRGCTPCRRVLSSRYPLPLQECIAVGQTQNNIRNLPLLRKSSRYPLPLQECIAVGQTQNNVRNLPLLRNTWRSRSRQ